MMLAGFHAVEEAVRAEPRRVEWVLFDEARRDRRSGELKRLCRESGVAVRYGKAEGLDRLARHHQGVVARLAEVAVAPVGDAFAGERGGRFLFVLDEVQDPHNVGAILRVAEAAGAGVVVHERGSAPLSDTVARVSAGALSRVPIFRAGNLRRFLDEGRKAGFFAVGLDERGEDLYGVDLSGDLILVFGSEGKGLRRLVVEGCDVLARLPMAGKIASLNVSTAASAAAFEAVRQRRAGGRT
ncbi:MAG TPA: 23S rRNA (guanosine(2251)-2'-O)-methyltransferase RlmB [Thermoanaerobaculia bacterium]|nr:23S rRNA (guanosine(2251)-2'-O)-methyltransferase RlmB [Thermoanaerobaculia bacterium]